MEFAGPEIVVVLCTVPDRETALRLARRVVEGGLAACANIVPGLTSVYRWEGAVREDPELLLALKTTRARFEDLRRLIVQEHPYEVPEVVALPVAEGHGPYLEWVRQATNAA